MVPWRDFRPHSQGLSIPLRGCSLSKPVQQSCGQQRRQVCLDFPFGNGLGELHGRISCPQATMQTSHGQNATTVKQRQNSCAVQAGLHGLISQAALVTSVFRQEIAGVRGTERDFHYQKDGNSKSFNLMMQRCRRLGFSFRQPHREREIKQGFEFQVLFQPLPGFTSVLLEGGQGCITKFIFSGSYRPEF